MASLVERDADIVALGTVLAAAAEGSGGVVVVQAPPGLGKTALLRRTQRLSSEQGLRTLTARGADLERAFGFGVVRQLFERPLRSEPLEHLLEGPAVEALAVFDAPPGQDGATASSGFLPLNALYWLLANLAEERPVTLVVDDAHWSDVQSLQFLGFLARRIETLPVAVVISCRSGLDDDATTRLLHDVIADPGTTLIRPSALSPSGTREVVLDRLGPTADAAFCAAVATATSGNPLFLHEILRVLASRNVAPLAASVPEVEEAGPTAIARFVSVRLERHLPTVQLFARALSVLGDGADPSSVARLADLTDEEAKAAARALEREGVLEQAVPAAFSHALVREAVLQQLSSVDRAAAHQRAADLLIEVGAAPEQVASHVLMAPPGSRSEHLEVLLLAAAEMRRRGAPDAALVYVRRARQERVSSAVRAELTRVLGNGEAYCLHLEEAAALLTEAVGLAEEPSARALCAFSLARFQNAVGLPDLAIDTLLHARSLLPSDESSALALRIDVELTGFSRVSLRRSELADERLAELTARRTEVTAIWEPAGDAIDAHLALQHLVAGDAARALELATSALAVGRLGPDGAAMYVAVQSLLATDAWDLAEQHLGRALRDAERRGLLLPLALVRACLARIALLRGNLRLAWHHMRSSVSCAAGPHFARPAVASSWVHLLIEQGRPDEAARIVEDSGLAEDEEPTSYLHLWLLDARARLRVAEGRNRAALHDALLCGRLYERWGGPYVLETPWRLRAASALVRLGGRQRAHALIDDELRLAERYGTERALGMARYGAAVLAGPADGLSDAAEAVALLERTAATLDLVRALEVLGTAQLHHGDRRNGRAALQRALDLAVECDATALADGLAALDPGVIQLDARRTRKGLSTLSVAERRVADLAAQDLSNRQIARQLSINEKTVEAHLSRTYRKLGVSGRDALTGALDPMNIELDRGDRHHSM